ncbi:MAG: aldose epimerase family protein [Candidatus Dormibacteria bacterium]
MRLRVSAGHVLDTDPDLIPNGVVRGVEAEEDLRGGPLLGSRRLDLAYVGAVGPVQLAWPDLALTLEFDEEMSTVVVYTPEDGVCIEPQTMWPDAPRLAAEGVSATGARLLQPGERLVARQAWLWS